MNAVHTAVARTGLVRPTQGRIVGGVCAGVADRFGMDAWAVRALFVLALMLIPGSQILIYPIAWVLMPAEGFVPKARPATYTPQAPQDVVR